MSIDYRDQICNRPLDADGFELPPWLNPFLSDFNPELVEASPEPEATEAQGFEPSEEDEAWLAEQSDEDWQGYAEWSRRLEELAQACEYMDRLEAMHYIDGDEQLKNAGLAVG